MELIRDKIEQRAREQVAGPPPTLPRAARAAAACTGPATAPGQQERTCPMHRALIVARMAPDSAADIAEVFAASDRGELPQLIGVTGRSLFQFGDLYLHLIEAERPPGPAVAKVTGAPGVPGHQRAAVRRTSARTTRQTWREPEGRHGARVLPLGARRRPLTRTPAPPRPPRLQPPPRARRRRPGVRPTPATKWFR